MIELPRTPYSDTGLPVHQGVQSVNRDLVIDSRPSGEMMQRNSTGDRNIQRIEAA
jgi:hypothetical protein